MLDISLQIGIGKVAVTCGLDFEQMVTLWEYERGLEKFIGLSVERDWNRWSFMPYLGPLYFRAGGFLD